MPPMLRQAQTALISSQTIFTTQLTLPTSARVLAVLWLLLTALLSVTKSCPPSCECISNTMSVVCKNGQLLDIFTQIDPKTRSLTLDNVNDLRTIKKARISDLKASSLIKLRITRCSVKVVEDNAFDNLTLLEDLDLSQNELLAVSLDSFSNLKELKSLNLSHNKLSTMGLALSPLPKLITFDVSVNFLKDIPQGAFTSQSVLTLLKLDGNPLKNLYSQTFTGLKKVREFRARECHLLRVEDEVFAEMPSLTLIDLGHNRLSEVPSSAVLSNLFQLKTLRLDDNVIQRLGNDVFARLLLQTMDLSYNRISKIDVQAFHEASLQDLDMSYNLIMSLKPTTFKPLANHVLNLNLAGNPLRSLEPQIFSDLRLLEVLNLSSCSLEILQHDLLANQQLLKRLDISHNNLHFLSQPLMDRIEKLHLTALHDNAWICNCEIKPLRDWILRGKSDSNIGCPPYEKVLKECPAMRCTAPSDLQNKQLSQLQDKELLPCQDEKSPALPAGTQGAIVASCLGFAIVLLLVTIFLWWRGKTPYNLKRACVPSEAESSHVVDEDSKIPPLVDCDRRSLTASDHNYVIRHYFDHLVTDPKLIANAAEDDGGDVSEADGDPSTRKERDSLYSSQPSLYSNHSVAAYGMESTV